MKTFSAYIITTDPLGSTTFSVDKIIKVESHGPGDKPTTPRSFLKAMNQHIDIDGYMITNLICVEGSYPSTWDRILTASKITKDNAYNRERPTNLIVYLKEID